MPTHFCDYCGKDEDGWWKAGCACGWVSPPVPGPDDACDAFADHRLMAYIEAASG